MAFIAGFAQSKNRSGRQTLNTAAPGGGNMSGLATAIQPTTIPMTGFGETFAVKTTNFGSSVTGLEIPQSPAKLLCGMHQVMNLVPHQMFILEPDFSACFENNAAIDYFGDMDSVSPREQIVETTHPEEVDQTLEIYDNSLRYGLPFGTECRLRGRDGEYRWFLVSAYPVTDEQGGTAYWCGIRIGIDDQKQSLERSRRETSALREEVDRASMFEEIVGTSAALRAALERVKKVAPTDTTVLITGETGTGKELVARAVHKRSPRASKPFISVNCAAIPKDLIASELFGHEKGAFTGALQRRIGRFEQAEGGTIFLDEIGELPAETQVALLRVLQEREFERVGGTRSIPANVRIICATHRDLPTAIEEGTFRSDLFYRINVFPVDMPPLRERPEDIRLLVQYFIDRFASKMGKSIRRIEKRTMERLQSNSWPGNIRELQNVIERSMIVCESDEFCVDVSWLSSGKPSRKALADEMNNQEVQLIEGALAESRGRVSGPTGAAAKLRMPPSTLDFRIKTLNIDKRKYQRS
jgi:DNA-binding NtrC family response regulator